MLRRKIKWFPLFEHKEELLTLMAGRNTYVHRSMFGEVLFVRLGDEIHAFRNRCPHQNKPLDNCAVRDGFIICPFHQFAFSCEDGKGQGMYIDRYPIKYEDGKVFIGREGWTLF